MKLCVYLLLTLVVLSGCVAPAPSTPAMLPETTPSSGTPVPLVSSPAPMTAAAPSSPANSVRTIFWDQASNYIGERMTVYGPVASTKYAERSNGQPTFLNMGRPYPNQGFTVVIWGRDRNKFPSSPEKYYDGKTIYVTGLIEEYRGVPEIIVANPNQIEVR